MTELHAPHIENFKQNLAEVERLLTIHSQISGDAPGRKYQVEVLNKSGIVLLSACWEAFVEDLVSAAFDFMLSNAIDHTKFPDKVLTLASNSLKKAPDDRRLWDLAGEGWITVLETHKQKTLDNYIGNFNTPRAENIDKLYHQLIGLPQLSSHWKWPGMSAEGANKKLSDMITLRGSIAHRVATSNTVRKSVVTDHVGFVHRLATKSNNRVAEFVEESVGILPWDIYKFGEVS